MVRAGKKANRLCGRDWAGLELGAPLERVVKEHISEEEHGTTPGQSPNLHPEGQNRDSGIDCQGMAITEKRWGFISCPPTSRFHKDEMWFGREVR